ncbi:VOC family protein [Sphingobium sp.]|uniref:VOC family protein n=1 Tax=Sphingobium sp. TaxID=1912891 RepID=UPI003BB6F474
MLTDRRPSLRVPVPVPRSSAIVPIITSGCFKGNIVSGMLEMLWSVFDIDRACAALVDVAGYVRTDLPDAGPDQAAAWGLPDSRARIRQSLLTAPSDPGNALRLVCFEGRERVLIRPSQRTWDTGGIFDLDIFSRDARAAYRALVERHGWTAFGEPVDYVLGHFDVTQVVARGPDGIVLAIIEPRQHSEVPLPPPGALSRIFNATQIVRDMDAAIAFFTDILGWRVTMAMDIDDAVEPGAGVLGLPMPYAQTVRRRMAIVHPDGTNDGSVELLQIDGLHGHDYAARATAPNIGLFAARFPVTDADATAAAIVARGGTLHCAPCDVAIAGIGHTRLFAIRTPEGAILEFFQITDTERPIP